MFLGCLPIGPLKSRRMPTSITNLQTHVFACCVQVYVGNYEYEADERDLEDLFKKYGDVKSVEYKSGTHKLFTTPP